ncbi:MAG: protein translocase subunit SecD [Sutterellaceae bacterium]|nr:protein translocase subunit SecD [Sutterellaceae bacterium]MDD7441893.1 protein translocase subunit SecD [Sutterellaceae bacterium]MDY2867419.1 protein translocase subunit SecD [Mesosutterella sp.]
MNRYPIWKYLIILFTLVVSILYTVPNFFGESPAIQVSPGKATVKVTDATMAKVQDALSAAGLKPKAIHLDQGSQQTSSSVRVRFGVTDAELQLKGREVLEHALNPDASNPDYVIALNLMPNTPEWLSAIGGKPMYLGLDLRGGVHFRLEVDMKAAIQKRVDSNAADLRTRLRDKGIGTNGIDRSGNQIIMRFATEELREKAYDLIRSTDPDLTIQRKQEGTEFQIIGEMTEKAIRDVQDYAIKQNISTLHNRINELGVAEPVIAQQGANAIVVELPGVQDTAKAKDILGRTATLEIRMVDDSPEAYTQMTSGTVPFGDEVFADREGRQVLVRRRVVLTGENLQDAQPGFDSQTQEPTVNLTLDNKGARIFKEVTRDNVGKRMAIILFEKGHGQVVTAPVIRQEIGGGHVQISGAMTTVEATDTALLLRAGSLAAPMEVVEERLVGPSLGQKNISAGFKASIYGFFVVAIFMILYYEVFGIVSAITLFFNVLLIVAILSMLQATLTLPGIGALALSIGMSVDSNVLINERIREELRAWKTPQVAIKEGYDRAFATIIDSNVTSLIAGIALLIFGSGPIRGFAIVHCLGILTSLFTAVFVSRGLVNFIYGRKKHLKVIHIGKIWRPDAPRKASGQSGS